MKISCQKGSAMVELAAAVPIVAIFLLVISQFATLFDRAVHDTANAEAEASRSINEWDLQHARNGLKRPCLEDMDKHSVTYGGNPVAIGVGAWRRMISVPQEVKIVSGEICAPW